MRNSPFQTRPAVRIALLLALGILIGDGVPISPIVCFAALAILALALLPAARVHRREAATAVVLQALVVTAGLSLRVLQQEQWARERLEPATELEWIRFAGVVLDVPLRRGDRYVLTVRSRDVRTSERSVDGSRTLSLVVAGQEGAPPWDAGSTIRGAGRLEYFPRPRNPGDSDPALFYELRGIDARISVESHDLIVVNPSSSADLHVWAARARSALGKILDRYHDGGHGAFLKGILLGDRSGIEPDVMEAFVMTGTMHVLAVSGLHVGVLAVAFSASLSLLRFSRKSVAGATIAALILYMMLTGLSPSVVRATIMATAILAGGFVERNVDVYQSLGIAALIILLFDPGQLFHPGFQLSFAAVISIVFCYPRLMRFFRGLAGQGTAQKRIDPILQLLAVSLAAQIGTLPLAAGIFQRFSLVGFVINVIVVPLVSVNVTLGFVTLVLSALWGWLGSTVAATNDLLVAILLRIVEFGSRVPAAAAATHALPWYLPFIYYPVVLAMVELADARRFRRYLLLAGGVASVALVISAFSLRGQLLEVTIIDVGQGDAILLETPEHHRILIDAGPGVFGFSAGERFVAPYLRRKGIASLDAVVVTHPHSDHIGGLPYLLENVGIGRIITSAMTGENRVASEVFRLARERGIAVDTAEAGESLPFDSNARFYVLHPIGSRDWTRNANDMSVVLKVVFGKTSFLFPGDAETEVEEKLDARFGDFLDTDALKVGHHGSRTSSSPSFLDLVSPQYALISVGSRNKFRHPSPEIVRAFDRRSVVLRRTDRDGALVLVSDGEKVNIVEWRDS